MHTSIYRLQLPLRKRMHRYKRIPADWARHQFKGVHVGEPHPTGKEHSIGVQEHRALALAHQRAWAQPKSTAHNNVEEFCITINLNTGHKELAA